MRYYLIAGEASGDLHGGNLVREIRKLDQEAELRSWGGDKMQAAGAELVKHYRELAFMGFTEVLMNLRTIFRNLAFCKEDILAWKPDAIVLIDYPGFNLRIAKWAKQQGIRVIYYISPQVWAWKEGRVRSMKQTIDKMLVILPFEKEYYKNKWDWDVEYVGHPLVEVIDEAAAQPLSPLSDKPIIALLPGSRKQEILKKLPVMLEVSHLFPAYQFIVAKAPGLDGSFYDELLKPYNNVSYVSDQTYPLLLQAKAALVTSGTATLETALFRVPEVVCYKGSAVSYQIARRVIKVKYISLVNLIMDRLVVKELIQDQLTAANIRNELSQLLEDPKRRQQLAGDYAQLHDLLSQGGHASSKAAALVVGFMKNT
ncbi:MAG: lipid-A-disaccharide synthase [Chitinophagaceae bacterium]|nr:MAG: lipid-A-disaccharide synthase [Chitinophagaceae bacterium]